MHDFIKDIIMVCIRYTYCMYWNFFMFYIEKVYCNFVLIWNY